MKYLQQLNLALQSAIGLSLFIAASVAMAAPPLNSMSKVQLNGIGAVRIGMSIDQAAHAAGGNLVFNGSSNNECRYAQIQDGRDHVSLMVVRDRIVRIDIKKGSLFKTLRGAGIGDSEDRIKSLYAGRIRVSPHKYTTGHYLTFVPMSRANQAYRLIFETDGQQVVNYRVGKLPEVGYVEGCS
jgi:hypothetical protein